MYENFSFSLAPRAATVQYNGTAVNANVSVGDTLTGTVGDHNFTFQVERVQEQGLRKQIAGAAHAEALLNSLIIYRVKYDFELEHLAWRRPKFSDHITAIAQAINKTIVFIGDDFYPKTDMNFLLRTGLSMSFYEQISGSFSEIMNRLIGWSDTVPSMIYNIYVDNGTIYIVQRGHETNIRTPGAWALTPTLTHAIRRTQWGNSATQTVIPKQIASSDAAQSNQPFTGNISWGATTLTYQDGYLTTETRGNSTTTYTYTDTNDGKYLIQKETVDTDENTYSITTYTYQQTGTETYLFEEATSDYDGQDATGVLVRSTLTRCVPIGGGWYGYTYYDTTDGTEEKTGENVSQGAPGQKASQYMTDTANDALKPANSQRQLVVPLTGVARARQTYPVADLATLRAIASCLDSYEGAEEITLQGEVVGGSHIYNYSDKIVYNGQEYFLVSNSVSRNYNTLRQSITAVRFVLPI